MAKAKKKAAKANASKKSSGKSSSAKQHEMLLVGSKTKDALRSKGCNIASDALEGLNMWVHWLIEQAASRAHLNGRKTVRPHDFIA